jgi:hypothetical protein
MAQPSGGCDGRRPRHRPSNGAAPGATWRRSVRELCRTCRCGRGGAEIATAGGRAIAVAADVADSAAVEAIVARTEAELGPVTILVNRIGFLPPITKSAAVTTSFEAGELAVGMITLRRRHNVRRSRMRRILAPSPQPCHQALCRFKAPAGRCALARTAHSHVRYAALDLTVSNIVHPPTIHRQHLRRNPA